MPPLCRLSNFFEFVHDTVSDRFACGRENVGILGEFEDFGCYFLHIFENRVASDLILEHLHVLEILDAVADIFKLGRTYGTLFLLTEKTVVEQKNSGSAVVSRSRAEIPLVCHPVEDSVNVEQVLLPENIALYNALIVSEEVRIRNFG